MTAGKRAKSLGHLELYQQNLLAKVKAGPLKIRGVRVDVLIPSPAGKIPVSFKPGARGFIRRKTLEFSEFSFSPHTPPGLHPAKLPGRWPLQAPGTVLSLLMARHGTTGSSPGTKQQTVEANQHKAGSFLARIRE